MNSAYWLERLEIAGEAAFVASWRKALPSAARQMAVKRHAEVVQQIQETALIRTECSAERYREDTRLRDVRTYLNGLLG